MKLNGKEFIIIGENVHTTRVVLRKGKLVTNNLTVLNPFVILTPEKSGAI